MLSKYSILCVLLFPVFLAGHADQVDASRKNKEIVKKTFAVVGSGQYDRFDDFIAPDYTRHCQATPGVNVNSLAEFKEFIRNDRKAIPDQRLVVHKLVAEGDLVAFWATYEGTQTGQMGPFPPSNKRAKLDFSGIHRIENGKVAETWVTWDNMAILSQLGHLPQMGEGMFKN